MSKSDKSAQDYMELGDRLLRRGWTCLAAAAYSRASDCLLALTLLKRARGQLPGCPREALRTLQRVEGLVGPSREGRLLLAEAYEGLGETAIARCFARAAMGG